MGELEARRRTEETRGRGEGRHGTRRDETRFFVRAVALAHSLLFAGFVYTGGGRTYRNGQMGLLVGFLFFFSAGKTDMPLRRPGDNVSVFGLPVGACDGFGKPYGVGMAVYLNFRGNSG